MAEDVRSVFGFVRERPVLVNLVVLGALLQFAVAPVNVAAPVFAPALALEGGLALGFLYSSFFTGMTAGTLFIGRYDEAVGNARGLLIVAGIVAFGGALAGATLVAGDGVVATVVSLGLFALAGLSFAAGSVPQRTLGQLLVPDERRGRYVGVVSTVGSAAFVAGLGLSGPLIELTSARTTLVGVGVTTVLVGAAFAFQPIARVHRGDGFEDSSTGVPESTD